MCRACTGEEAERGIAVPADLLARARTIEAGLAGRAVSETEWQVFSGRREGAISWPAHQRIASALQLAAGTGLRCEDAAG